MKKTIITIFALAGLAMGETVILTLPKSQQAKAGLGEASSISVNVGDASDIAKFATADLGIYMFCNGGQTNIGGTGAETEGYWTLNDDNTASVELWGRKQYHGTNVAVVTDGGLKANTLLTTLTLTTTGLTGGTDDYAVYFGIVDSDGTILASGTENNLGTSGAEITLDIFGTEKSDAVLWQSGYSLLLGFVSKQGTAWDTKSYVNGISVKAEIIPEPTTATLSLLALAGLAARRRRK